MAKILIINPSKWGRGITPIWIASHCAILKNQGHEVKLFDSTFYRNWMINELEYNTKNNQYKPSDYSAYIKLNDNDILSDLKKTLEEYKPDYIMWSAISSHLHGEGEYVNIQYGYELLNSLPDDLLSKSVLVTGGFQVTAQPQKMFDLFPKTNYFIMGESELVLVNLIKALESNESIGSVKGIIYRLKDEIKINPRQELIQDLDVIPKYDYSIFDEQIFYRPYNGQVLKAVDYELSRGCVHCCNYCVETVIQQYYGFDSTPYGTVKNVNNYLRHKSANRIFEELKYLNKELGIKLIRCQDPNFLTINNVMLKELATLIDNSDLDIILYIETRPEGITSEKINIMKQLKVDGIGMGVEVSSEEFRTGSLNRFSSQEKIIENFKLLKEAGIKRTTYNIIGLPEETEEMILETIKFNQKLDPDNITVAFYSPYIGTIEQKKSNDLNYFNDYEYNVDGQLRSISKSTKVPLDRLEYYKKNFVNLVRKANVADSNYSEENNSDTNFYKNKVVIGTWSLSGDYGNVDLKTIQEVLEYCYKNGFKEYDTAPSYGNGFIEFCLGNVFYEKKDVKINTKVGNIPYEGKCFDIDKLNKSFEQSLNRLKRDSVNILFLHNPRSDVENYDKLIEFMEELKKSGKIKKSGISLAKGFDYSGLVNLSRFDVVQNDANLLFMDYLEYNFCNNTEFMARSILANGLLSGKFDENTIFCKDDHRSGWLKGDRLKSLLKRIKVIESKINKPILDFSKQLILKSKKVNRVIYGIKKKSHIDSLLNDLNECDKISDELENELFKLYKIDFGLTNENHLKY
jgi:anaerobic magnesium-protoporphyrin IX monomethyl ester cyclase